MITFLMTSLLGKAIPSSFLTPAKSPYQTDIIHTRVPGHTVVEEAACSAHVAAAAPDSACAAAAEWDTLVTGDVSRTKLTLQEDPLVCATAQQLSFEDNDNNIPQEEHVRLVGDDPIRTPGPQQRGGDDKKHEPPALKQKERSQGKPTRLQGTSKMLSSGKSCERNVLDPCENIWLC